MAAIVVNAQKFKVGNKRICDCLAVELKNNISVIDMSQ